MVPSTPKLQPSFAFSNACSAALSDIPLTLGTETAGPRVIRPLKRSLAGSWTRQEYAPHPLRRSGVRRQSSAKVARRLKAASSTANEELEKLDIEPISDRVTLRSLRRTFASIRATSGDDPVYIAEQLGHTTHDSR